MLRVDKSPGKGIGVFAVKGIKKGPTIAKYPETPAKQGDHEYVLIIGDRKVTGEPWNLETPSKVRFGHPIAHLFNDGAILKRRDTWPGLEVFCADIKQYEADSRLNNTIQHDGLFYVTRTVKKDEELLFSYGWLYWTERHYGKDIMQFISIIYKSCLSIGCCYHFSYEEMIKGLGNWYGEPSWVYGYKHIPAFTTRMNRLIRTIMEPGTTQFMDEFSELWRPFNEYTAIFKEGEKIDREICIKLLHKCFDI